MGAVGGIIAVIFGVFWTILAYNMTRGMPNMGGFAFGDIFPLFGVLFIILGLVRVAYNFRNATAQNRFSVLDVTTDNEEPDPLNLRHTAENKAPPATSSVAHRLQELESLRQQGLVQPDEYQRKRVEILSSL